MSMTFKRPIYLISIAFLTVATILGLSACNSGPEKQISTSDPVDSQSALDILSQADRIILKKAVFSFGDHWDVVVDGKKIGIIRGEAIHLIGDTYSMYTASGNLMGREGEEFRIINHRAKVYDAYNHLSGYIDEQIFSWLYTFNIKDTQGRTKGTLRQDFALTLSGSIKDASNNDVWTFNKALFSFGAELTLDKKQKNPPVSSMEAIWMSVIVNEIATARDEKRDQQ